MLLPFLLTGRTEKLVNVACAILLSRFAGFDDNRCDDDVFEEPIFVS
jgi:hypothetical protein